MAAPHLDKPESPRAGFRVIRDEDAPTYDGQAQAKQKFTMIPESVRSLKSGYAVAVFEAIARHDNGNREAWPSLKTICDETGWSKKIVIPTIAKLIEAGALTKETRRFHGMDVTNLYRITAWEQVFPRATPVLPTATAGVSHGDTGCFPEQHEEEPVELKPIEQEPPTGDNPPTPERIKSKQEDHGFETEFWRQYPKGRGSKQDARRLWVALKPLERSLALDSLPLFLGCRDWGRGFHPAPEVWIRGRRWENPPEPETATGSGLAIVGGEVRTGGAAKGGMTPEEIRAHGRMRAEQERAAQEAGGQ